MPISARHGNPVIGAKKASWPALGGEPAGRSRFAEFPPVETVTITEVEAEPFKVKELGEIEQVEFTGAPLQLKVTA